MSELAVVVSVCTELHFLLQTACQSVNARTVRTVRDDYSNKGLYTMFLQCFESFSSLNSSRMLCLLHTRDSAV